MGGTGDDLAAGHQAGDVSERDPGDALGLEVVLGRADVVRGVGAVDVMDGVGDARSRFYAQQVPQRPGPPAGFLLGLAGGRGGGGLAGVGLAERDLPSPGVSDEPVPP